MSNSFLPKKSPNLLNQETLDRVLVALRQPFSLAVVASLAVHGLLWAALPNLLSDQQQEPDTQRKVQVVELSPAEQGQLPPLGINPLPTFLPTKPLPPAQSGKKLPDPKLYTDPSFNSMPVFPLPPPNIAIPDFSNLFPPIGATPKKEPRKQAATVNKGGNPPAPPVDPGTPKEGSDQTGSKAGAPARSATLSPEQIAALQKDAQRSRQLQELYTFSGPETQAKAIESAQTNATGFVDAALKLSENNYGSKRYDNPEKLNSPLPQEACPFVKAARIATVGAIVKPDGQLAKEPTLLLTTGFKGLDSLAIDDVNKYKFATSDQYQIVRFEITFDPSAVCQAAPSKPS